MARLTSVEQLIDTAAHRWLDRAPASRFRPALVEFLVFGAKQAWAALFGGIMLAILVGTQLWYPDHAALDRNDLRTIRPLPAALDRRRARRRRLRQLLQPPLDPGPALASHRRGVVVLFWCTSMEARVLRLRLRMPLLAAFLLVAFFIWLAENVGTASGTWLYPSQLNGWEPVPIDKMGSWFLLMMISVALVTWVYPPQPPDPVADDDGEDAGLPRPIP